MNWLEKRLSELLGTTCSDMDQALFRVGLMVTVAIYLAYFFYAGHIDSRDAIFLAAGVAVQTGLAVALVVWTTLVPDYRFSRRVTEFLVDRAGFSWLMSFGGAVTLPLYAMLLWITLGNGLRYGSNFLIAGVTAAFLGIAAAWQVNPFWQANPFVPAMLMFILVALPMYVLVLLHQIEDAYTNAKEANLSKSRMMAQASHDLRQPIHAISLFTACLRDGTLGKRELEMVDNIDRSLASVARLFKSLLDISALDSGRMTPKVERFRIGEVLEDVARQNAGAAESTGGELRVMPCGLHVSTDRALLTTILQNLVNNAVKYAPGQSILIGCRRRRGRLDVLVADTGPGIAAEHQARIFDEFYQVRERGDRDVEGVGLGLAIVRRVAGLLGLQVAFRSEPGRGTCVALAGLQVVDAPAAVTGWTPETIPGGTEGLRVLLVEDDTAVLQATASLLTRWGCIVQPERTIPQQPAPCDVLITDYDLGEGATGTDCIRAVRGGLGAGLPAIVMTGHDPDQVREEFDDVGVPVLSKPVRPAELRSMLMTAALNAAQVSPRIQPL